MGKRLNIQKGQRFGKLAVIEEIESRKIGNRKRRYFSARCDCGNTTEVEISNLTSGSVATCGCSQKKYGGISTSSKKDSDGRKLYDVWRLMIRRCEEVGNSAYAGYGGRGISVCAEFKDFMFFHDWCLSHGWSSSKQLDRIDNDENYSPDNCRFVSRKTNCQNRRNSFVWHVKGLKFNTAREAGSHFGVSGGTVQKWAICEDVTYCYKVKIYDGSPSITGAC